MRTDDQRGRARATGGAARPAQRCRAALAALLLLGATAPAAAQLATDLSASAAYTLRHTASGRPQRAPPSRDPYLQLIRANAYGADPVATAALAAALAPSPRRSSSARAAAIGGKVATLSLATLGCSGLGASVATGWPRLSGSIDPGAIGSQLAVATLPGSTALQALSSSAWLQGAALTPPCR
ncbi:hypothetical protein NRY95_20475 [Xanthomonas campestris pv. phormiicola]|nr:hypothetical protein [Xanthomonas campestris pv. phormiicola]UYC16030.1 hypothetical protein NRY95_20475 [Xanthomonas campestris pv. phormiicola]